MYLRLVDEGHDVRVYIADFATLGVMEGLLQRVDDWRAELEWIREARGEGVIVFEDAEHGALQDALRRDGFQVIGGSAFGDRLENDRGFGQSVLAELGLSTIEAHRFHRVGDAIDFIRERPARYVFKLDGGQWSSWRNYVGQAEDGGDMIALLLGQERRLAAAQTHGDAPLSFLLMRYVHGVEVGVGAYFNGERFLEPACLDWEHKRFCVGDLGELTGEMGTLVTYEASQHLFARTLAKLAPRLRDGGYVGYININTIINTDGIWPLELTCRFGYPGFAILSALQPHGWGDLLQAMLDRSRSGFAFTTGFALGVVLTVPPFPYRYGYDEISKGLPILFDPTIDQRCLSFSEVAFQLGQLVTSGSTGHLMVATGTGHTAEEAQAHAYAIARKVFVPNLRYRTDIGDAFIARDQQVLRELGCFG